MTANNGVHKGMRVFPPNEYRRLAAVFGHWRHAADAYGYREYRTPLIDPIELYTDKTSEEIVREQTYAFTDRGDRKALLRPEITPGASVLVAGMQRRRQLHAPARLFSIGSVFRYERTQRGRSREHVQFNADLFGIPDPWSDAEVIALACDALNHAGLGPKHIEVRINDRLAVETALDGLGLAGDARRAVVRLLDRRDKTDSARFAKELRKQADLSVEDLESALATEPDRVAAVRAMLGDGINSIYDPFVVRGFDYYTGMVFEIFAADRSVMPRSLVGGGRYDRLIESYGGAPTPAVGFGMGDTVLLDCLAAHNIPVTARRPPYVVLYAAADEHLERGREAANDLRSVAPVTFLGVVPKNRRSVVHKRYGADGASHIIRTDSDGHTVRATRTKTEATFPSPRAIITSMRGTTNSKTSLLARLRNFFHTV